MHNRWIVIFLFVCHMIYSQNIAIVVHGGAGNITPQNLPDSQQYKAALDTALNIGYKILKEGGSSIDAVEAVVAYLENNPLFNAGRGAVYNANGNVELDASIMNGKTLRAGAVAGVTNIKNPIKAARRVMEKTEHVLLIGNGASEFAKNEGLTIVKNEYFKTPEVDQKYQKLKQKNVKGTVGCVAIDKNGNLAAATSTGGMMMKKWGRVGDSPIIGAGTYANNATCAVSCTGHGEYFILNAVAFHVHALMLYKNFSLKQALSYLVDSVLTPQNATGGIIAIDKDANTEWYFNTNGMFRAKIDKLGNKTIQLFNEYYEKNQ